MIRIAAVGDIHVGEESVDVFGPHPEALADEADVLLLAGDLTRRGKRSEAEVLAGELVRTGGVPTIAVLGNHDYETDAAADVIAVLADVGVTVLEGTAQIVETSGGPLGVAGTKGFGGGFQGASGSEFGEPEMKAFIAHTRTLANGLTTALSSLNGVSARVALLHYSPIGSTLQGERLEIYPFLGSYLLAEAVDLGQEASWRCTVMPTEVPRRGSPRAARSCATSPSLCCGGPMASIASAATGRPAVHDLIEHRAGARRPGLW